MYKEPRVIVAPTWEPIELADAALQVRQDSSDDDDHLLSLITEAREFVERHTGECLPVRTLELSMDGFGCHRRITLPRFPLIEVQSVTYTAEDGTEYTLSTDYYEVDTKSTPGGIVLKRGYVWPSLTLTAVNGVVIQYTAGYDTPEEIPSGYIKAMKLLITHSYRRADAEKPIPPAVFTYLSLENVHA
jgi:uncharacterized phiE125 gp8 family phage protein